MSGTPAEDQRCGKKGTLWPNREDYEVYSTGHQTSLKIGMKQYRNLLILHVGEIQYNK